MGLYDLGLTVADLGAMTPRFLWALRERFLDKEEREDRRFGWLFTMYYNANRGKDAMARNVEDFMPPRNKRVIQRRGLTEDVPDVDTQIAMARAFTDAWKKMPNNGGS